MLKADWSSHVGILQDAIKVKDDFIYCPTTGQLICCVNLDETSKYILDTERGNQQASTERSCHGHISDHDSWNYHKFEVSIGSISNTGFGQ